MSAAPQPPVALYVHVPFCLSICPYCDFVVYGGSAARGPRNLIGALVDALLAEIALRGEATDRQFGAPPGRPLLSSVYIGGGTPSLLAPADVGRLLDAIDRGFGLAADAEVTLEANPGPAERGDLAGFRACGVNRLSIGAQSMEAAELRALGRRHSPADVRSTVRAAREAGMASVSIDMLYDIPGQTRRSWRDTLAAVLALQPDHVSAYALSLDDPDAEGLAGPQGDHLRLRPGARRWRQRARATQDEDRAADCYVAADRLLEAAGLAWYELSSWARTGHQSRHNLVYWRALAHEAVGPGAHAFDGALTRRWNAARIDGYLAALRPADGRTVVPPSGGQERIDAATAAAERVILGLRLREGLDPTAAADPARAAALEWGRSQGLVAGHRQHRLWLTMRGRLLANELFVRLLPADAQAAA